MKQIILCIIVGLSLCVYSQTPSSQRLACYEGDLEQCLSIKDSLNEKNMLCHDCYWPSFCYINSWQATKSIVINNKTDSVCIAIFNDRFSYITHIHDDVLLDKEHTINVRHMYIEDNYIHVHAKASYALSNRTVRSHKFRIRYAQNCFGEWIPEWNMNKDLINYLELLTVVKELPVKKY